MRSEPMVIQAARLAFFGVLLAAIGLTARAPAAPATVPAVTELVRVLAEGVRGARRVTQPAAG